MLSEYYQYGDPFKFNSLKTYVSNEFLANNSRKYRSVFDKSEISYLWWELRFYNKLFDEEDWYTKATIRVFEVIQNERREVFNLEKEIEVPRTENEVFVYYSWGTEEGGFWQRGTYEVEAYIGKKFISSEMFFVEDVGRVTATNNPFFEIESIRLYAGDEAAFEQENKKYLKVFNKSETQYVWVELKIKNKVPVNWNIELFFNFYDDAGHLKTTLNYQYVIDSGQENNSFVYECGWGQEKAGATWLEDKYRLDFVFMDTLMKSVYFEMGEKEVEDTDYNVNIASPNIRSKQSSENQRKDIPALEVLLSNLDELIGLNSIKNQLKEHIAFRIY